MIYVYPRRALPFTLEQWDIRKIPNHAYVKTGRNWHHKAMDRMARVDVSKVPKHIRTKHLLVMP